LKLGKVVGETDFRLDNFTWNASTSDGTTVRLPRQLIYRKRRRKYGT